MQRLVCKDLGCVEHMHKCWMPQECSRLGEIRVGKVARCLGESQGERRIHTKSYLVCKDLGCVELMHKCWSLQECSRLGEIVIGKVTRYLGER